MGRRERSGREGGREGKEILFTEKAKIQKVTSLDLEHCMYKLMEIDCLVAPSFGQHAWTWVQLLYLSLPPTHPSLKYRSKLGLRLDIKEHSHI